MTRELVQTSRSTFVVHVDANSRNQTQKSIEAAHRRNLAKLERASKAVEDYEVRLGVQIRWSPDDKEWQEAAKRLRKREYQLALDNVERLLVSCIFELSKMNLSQTGASIYSCLM
jgi:biotin synthase-related radical SAM superfamily protein